MKGYIFNSVQDAEKAIIKINEKVYFPKNATVNTYCNYVEFENLILIVHDDFIESVLGMPTQIKIELKPI